MFLFQVPDDAGLIHNDGESEDEILDRGVPRTQQSPPPETQRLIDG